MLSFFHTIAEQGVSFYLIAASFLGWNLHEGIQPDSAPDRPNQATSTLISTQPLPYLTVLAPEFKLIPVNRPLLFLPSPTPTPQPTEVIPPLSPKDVVVNIYCTVRNQNTITAVTGSGVIVSSQGIVLTNAHVAQYVLLADYLKDINRSCVVRTGDISKSSYRAHVLYISPSWIKNNAGNLKETNPKGTGEYDYAFLEIESGVKKLPQPLMNIQLSSTYPQIGQNISARAYPAGTVDARTVIGGLQQQEDSTIIDKVYSFGYSRGDLLVAETDALSQRGSSGGAIINSEGKLEGIISTSIPNPQTGHTSLAALSAYYISREYYNSTGKTLTSLLSQNPQENYGLFEDSTGFALAKLLLEN